MNQLQILDPGHRYLLPSYDGGVRQELVFMKREGPGFPGNIGHYPGTNLQSVLRACLALVRYLNTQINCEENIHLMCHLRHAIVALEQRAAARHGLNPRAAAARAVDGGTCPTCGHVICRGHL